MRYVADAEMRMQAYLRAGMLELLRTQGCWAASLRLAYQQVAASCFMPTPHVPVGPQDVEQQASVPPPSQQSLQAGTQSCSACVDMHSQTYAAVLMGRLTMGAQRQHPNDHVSSLTLLMWLRSWDAC